MIRPSQLFRLFYINWILARHGLDEVILATHFLRPLRFLIFLSPWYWFGGERGPRAERIRCALEDLGPIFVKFGQILSTRQDLLPDDIAVELSRLQDKVPPFPGKQACQLIESAFDCPLEQLFQSFDETPLASASVAQVHGAVLPDGRQVVVKVLRPDIAPVIRRDLDLMYYIAGLAQRYWRDGKRLRPIEVIQEFEQVIFDELDLIREAANGTQLRRNWETSDQLYIPEIYWPYVRTNVMVMERISGIPVSEVDRIEQSGVDLKQLAELGVEIFYTQVFRHNFFHADMHPGNIFVSPTGQYIAVDFGIVGALSEGDKRYLAENFLAFFNRDYQRVAELHVESGWVPSGTRVDQFESAIRAVCEPNFNKPLKDISFGQVLVRLFQTARRFNMEVQPQLVMLQKTLLNIEGLGRQLYPDLDLWSTAKPFLEEWTREQLGPTAFFRRMRDNLPVWSERFPELPDLVHGFLQQSVRGQSSGRSSEDWQQLREEIRQANQRTVFVVTGSALVLVATIMLALDGYSPTMLGRAPLVSWLAGLPGLGLLLAGLLKR